MGQATREILKTYFELGDKPTQAQFREWLDSYFHLIEDTLPIDKVENLVQILDTLNANLGIGDADANGKMHARKDGAWIPFDYIKDIIQTNIRAPFYQFKNTPTKDYMVGDAGTIEADLNNGGSLTIIIKYRNHELGVDFGLNAIGKTAANSSPHGLYLGIDDNNGLDGGIKATNGGGIVSSRETQELNRWYSAALTWDGANFINGLHLDGVMKDSANRGDIRPFSLSDNNIYIGAISDTQFNGNVDIQSYQVYNTLLTQEELFLNALNSDVIPRRVMGNLIIDLAQDKRSDKWVSRIGSVVFTNHGADLLLVPNQQINPIVETLTLTDAPTADPLVAGKIWNDNGVATFSAG